MTQAQLNVCKLRRTKYTVWMVLLFFVIAVVGLYYVKWNPYFLKALTAAQKHDIGSSIVVGKTGIAPDPSLHAAWEYSVNYFKAVWKAAVLGILLGSLLQVLVPRDWLVRLFGRHSLGSTTAAGAAAVPGMM